MRKNIIIASVLIAAMGLGSCNDWLDVTPKTEVKVKDNFKTEVGFKDALTGVYLLVASSDLYGRELTYGMADVLAQQYTDIYSTTHPYYYMRNHDFTNDQSIAQIENVWTKAYNAIANINVLIDNVDAADKSIFIASNQSLIKGEAYGLRAMIHFDLLRLFAPAKDDGTKVLPYVTKSGVELTGYSTVNDYIALVLADLKVAEQALKLDPAYEGRAAGVKDDEEFIRNRGLKFNYYAVKLLQARVNLWAEKYDDAFAAAQEVIDQTTFTWTPTSQITTTTVDSRNCIFSQELVFALNITKLAENYTTWFTGSTDTGTANVLSMSPYYWEQQFEVSSGGASDYRYEYLSLYNSAAYTRTSIKLRQPANSLEVYTRRLPVMRFTEAYYIAAEAKLHTSGVDAALPYLNTVRTHRNLTTLAAPTAAQMQTEIGKEYIKEFKCEGQLFYYYKRTGATSIMAFYNTIQYVLPLPKSEVENR